MTLSFVRPPSLTRRGRGRGRMFFCSMSKDVLAQGKYDFSTFLPNYRTFKDVYIVGLGSAFHADIPGVPNLRNIPVIASLLACIYLHLPRPLAVHRIIGFLPPLSLRLPPPSLIPPSLFPPYFNSSPSSRRSCRFSRNAFLPLLPLSPGRMDAAIAIGRHSIDIILQSLLRVAFSHEFPNLIQVHPS